MVDNLIHAEAFLVDPPELLPDLDDVLGEPLNTAIQLKSGLVDFLLEVGLHLELIDSRLDLANGVDDVENAYVKVCIEAYDVAPEVLHLTLAKVLKVRQDLL